MCTAGFPEPRTFSLRVARLLADRARRLRRRPRQPGASATACSRIAAWACRWSRPSTTRSPSTARSTWPPRTGWRKRLTLRRWYGFLRMQSGSPGGCRDLLTVSTSSAARHRRRLRRRPGPDRTSSRSASTPTLFAPPTAPRVPGRIVAMASADVPIKGIATLLEAIAKLRTERDVELHAGRPGSEPGGPHRAADRPSSASPTRARSSRPSATPSWSRLLGVGRGGLRAVALRGLLAARPSRRWPAPRRWWPAAPGRCRRCVGPDGECADLVAARRRRARWRRRSAGCWTTPSGARGWARPAGAGRSTLFSWRAVAAATHGVRACYRATAPTRSPERDRRC